MNYRRNQNQQRPRKPGKGKKPQIQVEIFHVPMEIKASEKAKVDKAIKRLPWELGNEHSEPDKSIFEWLNDLSVLKRRFFYREALRILGKEELIEALKKLATVEAEAEADKAEAKADKVNEVRSKKAVELGLLPEKGNGLPSRANFKFNDVIQQMRERKPGHIKDWEEWRKKLDELVELGAKYQEELTILLAPLKSFEAENQLKTLMKLDKGQRKEYLGVENEDT